MRVVVVVLFDVGHNDFIAFVIISIEGTRLRCALTIVTVVVICYYYSRGTFAATRFFCSHTIYIDPFDLIIARHVRETLEQKHFQFFTGRYMKSRPTITRRCSHDFETCNLVA